MSHDLRYAFRVIARQPLAAALTVATLALGIAATTSIFSAADRLLLRPLPYPQPEALYVIHNPPFSFGGNGMALSPGVAGLGVFDGAGMYAEGGLNIGTADEPLRVPAAAASPGVFEALGVRPALGRAYTPEEDVTGANAVAMISDGLWRRLGGDQAVLDRPLMVNLRPFRVVGVMPPGFGFPGAADVWIPPFSDRQLTGQAFGPEVVARLRLGVTPQAAEEALARFKRERGSPEPETDEERTTLVPLQHELTARVRPLVLLLSAGVGLLLLVSCSNVAGLLLSRVARRHPEFVLRRALGGSRWRLTRLLIVESLVLSTAAGLLGAAGAAVILPAIPRLIDQPIPGVDLAAIDGRLLLIAMLVSAGTGVAFGLAPGLAAGAHPAAEVVRASATATGGRAWRWFRSSLVVAQVALALALLAISGSAIRTATRLADVDLGFGNDRALSLELALPLERYAAPEQVIAFYRDASERLGAVPGVVRVGATGVLPGERALGVGLALNPAGAGPRDPENPFFAAMLFASPGYFESMGVPLLQGRPFLPSDSTGSPRVIILSESAVRELWPDGRSAIGQRVEISTPPAPVEYEVVGVTADVLLRGPEGTGNRRQFYRSILQSPPYGSIAFVVETAAPPESLVPSLRAALAGVDPALPMYNVQPVGAISARFLAPHRLAMALMGSFAVMTLLLSAIGLYGVLAQVVAQRTREIGIRMALGADGGRVIRHVVFHGMRLAALGVVLGAAAAGLAASLIGSFLPSLDPPDGMTIAVNAVVLLAVAAAATWMPARRAATVDPLRALRSE